MKSKANSLVYKGFHGTVHYSAEDELLFGEIIGISDLVLYSADSAINVREKFEEAVDHYIETCNTVGKKPMKSFTGSFNVRLDPETHLKAVIRASTEGKTLNKFIKETLEKEVRSTPLPN